MHSYDATTFELTEARLRLKPGLQYSIQSSRHGQWYKIEDESRSSFYRIGPAEYTFLSLLDGETTLASAMAKTCSLMGASALNENDAVQLCQWLLEAGLAHTEASTSPRRLDDQKNKMARQKAIQKLNPISIRIPLWNPDHFVENATRYLGWMISWPFALVWMFVCTYGLLSVVMDWNRLFQNSVQVFSRDGMFWMIGTWLILKAAHELAHAVTCKKFGGRVGNCGILFLLMIPLPFVDVTNSWRFSNKYHRILVSSAGMMAEMFLAAIAAVIWSHSGPGVLSFHASNVILAASLHTLLFNANPLLKFDGYHILADWLELPNLGNHGQQYVMGIARRWFLNLAAAETKYAGVHGQIIKVYGVAALLWRVMLCIVLAMAACNLFHGFGVLIALMAGILWFGMPTWKFILYMIQGNQYEQPDRHRFAMVVGLGTATVVLIGLLAPAPSVINAPVVVDFDPLYVVRNEAPGFVRSVHVAENEKVAEGDLLVVLQNPELETQLIGTKLKLRQSQIRANSRQLAGDIAALQIEQQSIEALEKQLVEIEDARDSLQIRAANTGTVIGHDLQSLVGGFVEPGTELLQIGNAAKKEALALVSQDNAKYLSKLIGQQVQIRIWGHSSLEPAVVKSVNPRSQDDLPHFAFAGMYGGPLQVANRKQIESSDDVDQQDMMLIRSRVKVRVGFDAESSRRLHAGQTGIIHLRGRSQSLGGYVVGRFWRWMTGNLKLSHGI